MYPVAELFEGRVRVVEYDGLVVVRYLSLWLGVDTDHVAVIPHLLQELRRNTHDTKTAKERRYRRTCKGGEN